MLPCIRLNTKWRELASLLGEIFTATGRDGRTGAPAVRDGDGAIPRPAASPHQKLVIFTEHRDTLHYLQDDGVGVGVEVPKDGGAIVAEGTPETIAAHHATSHTGRYLKERLGRTFPIDHRRQPLDDIRPGCPVAVTELSAFPSGVL